MYGFDEVSEGVCVSLGDGGKVVSTNNTTTINTIANTTTSANSNNNNSNSNSNNGKKNHAIVGTGFDLVTYSEFDGDKYKSNINTNNSIHYNNYMDHNLTLCCSWSFELIEDVDGDEMTLFGACTKPVSNSNYEVCERV